MKNLVLAVFVLFSSTAFASDISEFERGYNDGVKTCPLAQEAWICTLPAVHFNRCSETDYSVSGATRAVALLKVNDQCLADAISSKNLPVCTKL